jgi:dipeptide/tripeptide permease
VIYFSCNVCFASLPLFVPTIISELGSFSSVQSNGLSAPPYLLVFFTIIIVAWLSDRFKVRGPFCALAATVAAVGYILLGTTSSTAPRYLGVFLTINIFVSVAILLTWTANIHASQSKRTGGYIILTTVGQCGPLLGTNIFPSTQGPFYRRGMWISCAFCLLVAVLSTLLSCILIWENRKLDRKEHEAEARGEEILEGDRRFRYIW